MHLSLEGMQHGLNRGVKNVLEGAGAQVERAIIRGQDRPYLPPVFIVGQSRAGTTLLYQILCSHLRFAYVSNLVSKFPRCPSLVTLVSRILGRCSPTPCYESRFGVTEGWWQPNSGYRLWRRWFGDGTGGMSIEPQSETARAEIVGTISLITRICKRPFINKWTANTSRIALFSELFPDALFLVMKRSLLDVAQSQLQARRKLKGDPSVPFVTWPQQYDPQDGEDYIEDIWTHIIKVDQGLRHSIQLVGSDRFQEVDYEHLCASPARAVSEVQAFYHKRSGYLVGTQAMEALPKKFTPSRSRKVSLREYQRLTAKLREFYEGCM